MAQGTVRNIFLWIGWALAAVLVVLVFYLSIGRAAGLVEWLQKWRPGGKDAKQAGDAARAATAATLDGATPGEVLAAASTASGSDITGAVTTVADRAAADVSGRAGQAVADGQSGVGAAEQRMDAAHAEAVERLRRAASGGGQSGGG